MPEAKSNTTFLQRIIVPLGLALLTVLFFAPVLLTNNDLGGSDFEQIHYPLLKFVVNSVYTGEIPLWNPHQFLGYSVVGNPQYGLLYPPNWLLLIFRNDIYSGVAFIVALHLWWMAYGLTIFYQQWGASKFAACVGAIVVAFGGFVGSKIYAGHYAVLLTVAWLPWMMAGYCYAYQKGTWQSAIWGGIALGLAILAGHPQFAYLGGVGLGLLWLHALFMRDNNQARLRVTRQFILVVVLGLLLGIGSWLPTLDYQDQTVRGQAERTLDFANQHAVPLRQLVALVVPNTFGVPNADVGYWGEPFYEEMTGYVGWLPFLFLFLGGAWPQKRFALALIFFGVVMALGAYGGLYALQYYLVPPARGFRAPGRFLIFTSIGFGMILALGMTALQYPQEKTTHFVMLVSRRLGLPLLIICSGAAIAFAIFGDALAEKPQQADFLAEQLAWATCFLFLALIALWAWRYSKAQFVLGLIGLIAFLNVLFYSQPLLIAEDVQLSEVWQDATNISTTSYGRIAQIGTPIGIINGSSWTGHYSSQGYDPIAPNGWFTLMDATGIYIQDAASATNRLFGVRYVVAGQPLENYGFGSAQYFNQILPESQYFFYENPTTLARAYITQRYEIEENDQAAIQRILQGEVDRGDVILLDKMPNCTPSGRGGTATIVDYQPNQVVVEVEADGAGILVLGDQYDPDWMVRVNGQEAQLLRVNTTFRGVCVPDGASTVEFSYRPTTFFFALVLGGLGWFLILAMLFYKFFLPIVFAK